MSSNLLSYQNLISIHALREEGDRQPVLLRRRGVIFLSTPSARRATRFGRVGAQDSPAISIHALREEGDLRFVRWISCEIISIHALREEGDGDDAGKS